MALKPRMCASRARIHSLPSTKRNRHFVLIPQNVERPTRVKPTHRDHHTADVPPASSDDQIYRLLLLNVCRAAFQKEINSNFSIADYVDLAKRVQDAYFVPPTKARRFLLDFAAYP